MIKTKIGDLDVLYTGSVASTDESTVEMILGDVNPFHVKFELAVDEQNLETRMEAFNINELGIGIKFINFKNSLGSGNVQPVKLGWLLGRSLFLNYRVFPINDHGFILTYTWLHGKRVDQSGNEIE